ncbi:MAG TPA: hypothetical protein VIY27_10460 [Myxococcota bacterium]
MNWDPVENVDFEIEVFLGPAVNTGGPWERSFGTTAGTVAPSTLAVKAFELAPPTSRRTSGASSYMVMVDRPPRRPAVRPLDAITGTPLAFNKAAYEGFGYAEFVEALGLEDTP